MPPSDKPSVKARPAYLEELDSDGERVRGTKRTATTKKKDKSDRSARSSKEKEKKKPRSDSGYSSHAVNAGSDAWSPPLSRAQTAKDSEPSREDRPSRRKSMTSSPTKSPGKSSKPPSVHLNHDRNVNFLPSLEIPIRNKNDPAFYGVSPTSSNPGTAPSRPTIIPGGSRSARPKSYYGGMPQPDSRPPMAPSAFYIAPSPVMPQPTSYPPASPSGSWMNHAAPFAQADSYFSAQPQSRVRPLADRFLYQSDPIQRTTSASGIRGLTQAYYDANGYKEPNPNSIRRRSKELEDLRAMPPPPRPEVRRPTIRRVTTTDSRDAPNPFTPYSDEREDDERWERRMSRTIRPEDAPRRRSSLSRSRAYTLDPVENSRIRIETPNGRRRSYYDEEEIPRSAKYEGQVRQAAGYQEEVAGPTVHLTAEALRRSQRPSGSSRSTRSSGSRDESEFKRSATTRTTTSRSGHGQDSDDVTIRFKGAATMNISGAEFKCDDGAEVNIIRRKSIRNGSERSGSEYNTASDDRQSRGTRPVNSSRSTSKSGYSHSNPWVEPRVPRVRGEFI